jgi:hypothetical protein
LTIGTQLPPVSYIEDGVTTVFPVPFRFLAAGELTVDRLFTDGTTTRLALGADYSAAGVDNPAGGSITRTVATNGAKLVIGRATTIDQEMHYADGDNFPAASHERALDKLTAIAQEESAATAEIGARALRVPKGETIAPYPAKTLRAGRVYGFDDQGQLTAGPLLSQLQQIIAAVFNPVYTMLAGLVMYIAAGIYGVTRSVLDKLRDIKDLSDYMTAEQLAQCLACKFQTDPAPNMTAVLQGLIDTSTKTLKIRFPGMVETTGQLTAANGNNVAFYSDNSAYQFSAGEPPAYTGGGIRYAGAANAIVLKLDTCNGSWLERFLIETKSSDINVIDIPGVIGVQIVNKAASHFFKRDSCAFSKLEYGVHFYDEGLSQTSDFNMDGQFGVNNAYLSCVEAIRVEQTNVYGGLELRPSFANNANYSKHMVNQVKGHISVDYPDCFGAMKDAASPGGKDGIGFFCQRGYMSVTNIHSEIKNAPIFDWVAPGEGQDVCILSFLGDNTETASLPHDWEARNQTDKSLIIHGSIANPVEQLAGTTGSITIVGAKNPGATAASEPNAVVSIGGSLNSRPGPFGTLPNGTSGGGKATLQGYGPALTMFDRTTNDSLVKSFLSKILKFAGPGGAWAVNYNANYFDLRSFGDYGFIGPRRTLAQINSIWATSPDGLNGMVCIDSTLPYTGANIGTPVTGGGIYPVPIHFEGGVCIIGAY